MKFRVLLLLALFLATIPATHLQAQQGLLLLEKGSVKVIGPERTRLLRKPGAKIVLHAKDRVQTGKDTSVKIRIRGKPELIELSSRSFFRMGKITRQTSSISLLTGKARFKIQGKLKIVVTENPRMTAGKSDTDIIVFPKGADELDISSLLRDAIVLEQPMKEVCDESCKGLCAGCGVNLNQSDCGCLNEEFDERWAPLKEIKLAQLEN